MAKPDWGTLQQQFLTEHAKSGISPKEWCEDQGLNYATARRYIKKPAAQSAQKTAQSREQDSAHDDENTFDVRNYGLNDSQVKFVNEYLIDLNRAAAYKRVGYKGEGNTAYVNATRMLRFQEQSRTR